MTELPVITLPNAAVVMQDAHAQLQMELILAQSLTRLPVLQVNLLCGLLVKAPMPVCVTTRRHAFNGVKSQA